MFSIQTKAHVGADGKLAVQLPAEYCEQDVDVTIIMERVEVGVGSHESVQDMNGWPTTFFENTAGAWQGEPLVRGEQGSYGEQQEASRKEQL